MTQLLLDRLLAGTLPDCDGGPPLSTTLRTVVLARHLAASAGDLVAPLGLGANLAVVMDPDTRAALGEAVVAGLGGAPRVQSLVLPPHPHPDMDTVASVRAATKGATPMTMPRSTTETTW